MWVVEASSNILTDDTIGVDVFILKNENNCSKSEEVKGHLERERERERGGERVLLN